MPTLPTLEEALDVRRRETPGAPFLDLEACRTDRERAIEVVRWVDAVLERRLWTEDELRGRLLARTPREILAEGHICFATPCFDLTSVTAEVLRSQGFRCTVVLCRMKRFLQPVALQSGIELELDGLPHFIGFGRTSKQCHEGRYVVTGPRKAVHRRLAEGDLLDTNYLTLFGVDVYADLHRVLDGYDPGRQIARFARMQRPGVLRRARRRSLERAREARPGHIPSPGLWQDV